MAISIKSAREIELMREAGRILGTVLRDVSKEVKEGMSTYRVNQIADEMIRSFGCIPSFLNYQGFPGSVCVSVNEQVVHGIPDKKKIIQDGDIVSIDAGVIYKGYQSDACRTVMVGNVSDDVRRLVETTEQSFYEGIKYAKDGCRLHEISNAIAKYNEDRGYGVIRDLVGHGIGTELHEEPQIPNFTQESRGVKLKAGMTLAIEPMVAMGGDWHVDFMPDGWNCLTRDRSMAAHYENTVLVTMDGPEILSLVE